MRFKSQKLAGFIVILLALAMILPVSAFEDEQTRHIELTDKLGADADTFVTEAGIGYSTSLVTITDPNMDIYAYLFFEDIKINYWHYLENATLRLRTASSMSFDADSSVTIYGVDDYIHFGSGTKGYGPFGAPSDIMNAPLTTAHVNYNTSQFYGSQWWEIDVTNIVQELKSNPHWDGPGFVRADPGDNMGFIILGTGGYDTRFFYDLKAGNDYEAQLHLHWTSTPFPPSGYPDAIFNQSYGNYTIWEVIGGLGYPLEPMEYTFAEGTGTPYDLMYDTAHDAPGTPVSVVQSEDASVSGGSGATPRKLVRTSDGTLYAVYIRKAVGKYQVYVKQSIDEGATWTDETLISTFAGMNAYNQYHPSIAVDSRDYLHVVFVGMGTGFVTHNQIFYALYDGSWQTPVRISTYTDMDIAIQSEPFIAVDSGDDLHAVWYGPADGYPAHGQVWYALYNGSWQTPVRISTYAGMDTEVQYWASIAVDSSDNLHVAHYGYATGFDSANHQIWYTLYNGSWQTPVRISTYAGMETELQYSTSIAVDSSDNLYVGWFGEAQGFTTDKQVWIALYNGSWQTPVRISTYSLMNLYDQGRPILAVDSDDVIHVLWDGMAEYIIDADKVWYANYTNVWTTPICVQPTGRNKNPSIRWARWPVGVLGGYIVADNNGTVIQVDLETIEDAQDWIDTYDPDPDDPDPAGEWGTTGPFTRFKLRLYCLILGFGCLFGPVLFFSWRRPSAYYLMVGAIIMIAGLGLLMFIGDI